MTLAPCTSRAVKSELHVSQEQAQQRLEEVKELSDLKHQLEQQLTDTTRTNKELEGTNKDLEMAKRDLSALLEAREVGLEVEGSIEQLGSPSGPRASDEELCCPAACPGAGSCAHRPVSIGTLFHAVCVETDGAAALTDEYNLQLDTQAQFPMATSLRLWAPAVMAPGSAPASHSQRGICHSPLVQARPVTLYGAAFPGFPYCNHGTSARATSALLS